MTTRPRPFASFLPSTVVVAVALAGCAAGTDDVDPRASTSAPTEEVASTQQELRKGGLGTTGATCVDKWQTCYIDCGVRHPDGDMREGCEDSCDAAYRLCNAFGGGGGGGIIMQ